MEDSSMTSNATQQPAIPPPVPPRGPLIPSRHRVALSYVLLALALGLAVVTVLNWKNWEWPVSLWAIGVCFTLLFVGLWARFFDPTSDAEADNAMRMFLLTVGGLIGLLTAFLGLVMPFAMYSEVFLGGL